MEGRGLKRGPSARLLAEVGCKECRRWEGVLARALCVHGQTNPLDRTGKIGDEQFALSLLVLKGFWGN